MGRREQAKEERRERIVTAARELIRETGDAGLSMRALATRAGVSLTTPYNLFGSKRAIVLSTLQEGGFAKGMERYRDKGPMDQIFGALSVATGIYIADQRYYLALFRTLFDVGAGAEYRNFFGPGRHIFWRAMTNQAIKEGLIDPDIEIELFTSSLEQSILSGLFQWVLGDIGPQHLEPCLHYGFSLVLGGVATEKARGDLKARREGAEARLAALTPANAS